MIKTYTNEHGKEIPCLGSTADEVLSEALKIDTRGWRLIFSIVGFGSVELTDGEWWKTTWSGNVALLTDKIADDFVLRQIANGCVGVFVQPPGKNPQVRWEYHRATAQKIPLEA
jgi:hypothetical protein